MTPSKAFGYYFNFHLHFTSDKFDVTKYGTWNKATNTAWNKLTPNQKYRYDWCTYTFPNPQDLVYAIIGCEFDNAHFPSIPTSELNAIYTSFKSRRESLSYYLKEDYNKYIKSGETKFHQILFSYLAGKYSPEFILLLNSVTNDNLSVLYESSSMQFASKQILKLKKYNSFFNAKKYQHIINHEKESESTSL